jgi:hypothetical protein
MALYAYPQNLYRRTILGHSLHAALADLVAELPSSSPRVQSGAAAVDVAVADDAGADADAGALCAAVASTSAGLQLHGLVDDMMYELEKATAMAFSRLAGKDSGE